MKNIFTINKPKNMTSHDVVNIVRRITGEKRVGHGGTLDPLATGVLVIAVGREFTKQLENFVKGEKEYVAIIKLGFESTTDDEEGEKTEINTKIIPSTDDIERTIKKYIGLFPQTPPLYSAKKVHGKEAYKFARRGKTVTLSPKKVEIMQMEILSYDYPILKIRVKTGPGVYIRALARDIGRDLGTGAYLAGLERTKVGKFTIEQSVSLEEFEKYLSND